MQRRWALAGVILLSVCNAAGAADEPGQESTASYWMQKKMSYSEKILAGLSSGDFDAIEKNARAMGALNQMEKWVRGNVPEYTSEYRAQLKIFQNADEQLMRAAKKENLDAAALAYFQLTLSCINCHKIVRDIAKKPDRPSS